MSKTDFNYKLFFNLSLDLVCIAGFDGYFKKINPDLNSLIWPHLTTFALP